MYYHATFGSETGGKWVSQLIEQPLPMTARALITTWRVGRVLSETDIEEKLATVMNKVPADGLPSPVTGKVFNCRSWVFDSLAKLEEAGLLKLKMGLGEHVLKSDSNLTQTNEDYQMP